MNTERTPTLQTHKINVMIYDNLLRQIFLFIHFGYYLIVDVTLNYILLISSICQQYSITTFRVSPTILYKFILCKIYTTCKFFIPWHSFKFEFCVKIHYQFTLPRQISISSIFFIKFYNFITFNTKYKLK